MSPSVETDTHVSPQWSYYQGASQQDNFDQGHQGNDRATKATTDGGATKPTQPMKLHPEQLKAIEAARSGANLFLTIGPGTGKSYTCRAIIAALKQKHPGGVMVMAPTGMAAIQLDGQTMHSKPGPGVPQGTTEKFGAVMMVNRDNASTWKKVKVLVIDEVSMVDAESASHHHGSTNVPVPYGLKECTGKYTTCPRFGPYHVLDPSS